MKITTRTIVALIMSLIFVVVLFQMLPGLLPQAITSVNSLFSASILGNETLVGAAPAAFAANVTSYLGWFWVVSPFVLVIGIILGLFLVGGRRR